MPRPVCMHRCGPIWRRPFRTKTSNKPPCKRVTETVLTTEWNDADGKRVLTEKELFKYDSIPTYYYTVKESLGGPQFSKRRAESLISSQGGLFASMTTLVVLENYDANFLMYPQSC